MTRKDRWLRRWKVAGSDGHSWTVAQAADGSWGCSCPRWRFRREECHHIKRIQQSGGQPLPDRPVYVLANVERIEVKDGQLLVPLVCVGDTHQEAAVCDALLANGYSMGEVRAIRRIPSSWTAKSIQAYIAARGQPEFPL